MLTFTSWIVRITNWLNWIFGGLFAFLLVLMAVEPALFRDKFETAFGSPLVYQWMVMTLIGALCVVPLAHIILTRLRDIVASVRDAASFNEANARRLTVIAWSLLVINILDLAFGYLSIYASEATGEYFGWSFSITSWMAVLLLFILARVFREGALMRDDLDGTV